MSASRINLSWQDNATNETGFSLERCAGSGCTTFELVATVGRDRTNFTNSSLTEGDYCYRVRAFNNSGAFSAYSASLCQLTLPLGPRWSSVRTLSDQTIELTWVDQSATETGFVIERCPTSNCATPLVIATVGANVTTYQNSGLTANTLYAYRVYAINSGGNSTATSYVSRTTGPNPPSNLTATAVGARQITLNWQDNATNENGFRLARCTSAGCTTPTWFRNVVTNTTQFNNSGLVANSTYCYQVRSFNTSGPSRYTDFACATAPATLTAAETDSTAELDAPNAIEHASATLRYVWEKAMGESRVAVDLQTPLTVQAQPRCAGGAQPTGVELALGAQRYPMLASADADNRYYATLVIAQPVEADSTYALDLIWQCAGADEPQQESLGGIQIIMPTDLVTAAGPLRFYLPLVGR